MPRLTRLGGKVADVGGAASLVHDEEAVSVLHFILIELKILNLYKSLENNITFKTDEIENEDGYVTFAPDKRTNTVKLKKSIG